MSLRDKLYKTGDKVFHFASEAYGVVIKDVSNQYAEVYWVKFENGSEYTCSASLLLSDNRENRIKKNRG